MLSTPSGGMLATAGGLLFTGDRYGYLIAMDARTGKVVWKFQTGAGISAPAVTYTFEGKQYVAVASAPASLLSVCPEVYSGRTKKRYVCDHGFHRECLRSQPSPKVMPSLSIEKGGLC